MKKIKFTESVPAPIADTFPNLFRYKKTGMVVLALDDGSGVVTNKGDGVFLLGHFCHSWHNFGDKEIWEKVRGKVEFELE